MFRKKIKKQKLSFFRKIFNKIDNKDNDEDAYHIEEDDFSLLTTMYNFDEAKISDKWQNPLNLNVLYHSIDDFEIFNENEEQRDFNLNKKFDGHIQKNKNNNENNTNRNGKRIHIWKKNKSMKFPLLFGTSFGFSGGILGIFICQFILPSIC